MKPSVCFPRGAAILAHAMIFWFALHFAGSLSAAPRVTKVEVGLNGVYQAGRWTEVTFTVAAGESHFLGEAFLQSVDADGTPYEIPLPDGPVAVAAGASQRLKFHFRPVALENPLTLSLRGSEGESYTESFTHDDEREALRVPRALPANRRLMVSVGPSLGAVETFRDSVEADGERTDAAELAEVAALPQDPLGFDAIDTLLISTSSPELHGAWQKHPEQHEAMLEWLRLGGRVVLPIGSEAAAVLAPDHPLAQLVPGTLSGEVALLESQTLAWEQYAMARQPLPLKQNDQGAVRLRVPNVADFRGRIEAPPRLAAGQPPLVARAPFGFGEVVFVAADLDQPPFSNWGGRPNLLRRLTRSRIRGDQPAAAGAAAREVIDRDLAVQLRQSLDEFPGVRLASFVWVAILVIGYVALIGPGDFRLQRAWKRMERTWYTFPLVAILTAFLVYRLAASLKGDELRINQVDVIDVAPDGLARGMTVANIFTPRMVTYDLSVRPAVEANLPAEDAHVLLSAYALGPAALTGESERTSIAALSADTYQYAPALNRLENLPLQIWSSKGVAARWHGKLAPLFEHDLRPDRNEQLAGSLKLTADLQLEDCWLVYGDTVARLELQPGREVGVAARDGVTWSSLSMQLRYPQRKEKVPGKDDFGTVGTQWDLESTDTQEILRQVIFYDAAGATSYTRSWNGPLRQFDLSDRRDLGQAMVVAFVKSSDKTQLPGARLLDKGQPLRGTNDQHWTVLRCLLPVSKNP